MHFTLRVDLDYVPWDTPDAKEYGHGEPALLLRLLEAARQGRLTPHFFASNRVLRAFPSAVHAILADSHPLDWLCKHPESMDDRLPDALVLFEKYQLVPQGLAVRRSWPTEGSESLPPNFRFLSASPGPTPTGVKLFPVEGGDQREAFRLQSTKVWAEKLRVTLREQASRSKGLTLGVRPQVLARVDPHLQLIGELTSFAEAIGLPRKTLRELV